MNGCEMVAVCLSLQYRGGIQVVFPCMVASPLGRLLGIAQSNMSFRKDCGASKMGRTVIQLFSVVVPWLRCKNLPKRFQFVASHLTQEDEATVANAEIHVAGVASQVHGQTTESIAPWTRKVEQVRNYI